MLKEYIKKQEYDINHYGIRDFSIFKAVTNCIESFKLWYEQVFLNNDVQVLGMEEKMSCEYFGGTYDALLNINGKTYLVDFKTSNYISYKYFLQIAAYRYMLQQQGINIDGAIIIQLDNEEHLDFINNCEECFFSLVYAFFNRLQVEQQFKTIFN